jgi:arsenate reductase
MTDRPTVLFVCVHNAGRSQMAAALLKQATGGSVDVRSAGSEPAAELNPAVVEVMCEIGIDLVHERPKLLDLNRPGSDGGSFGWFSQAAVAPPRSR